MAETDRLSESTEWIDLGFVERERTPREIIEKGIRHHLAGLSLSNTVILLDFGVDRSRVAVHNWVQKADLQPADGEGPDRVTVDQKAIRINDEQYWLYAAVDPQTNRILHSRLFPTYTIPIAREFLTELADHGVAVSSGSACHSGIPSPSTVLTEMEVSSETALGAVRFSMGRHTSAADIDHTATALETVLEGIYV